MGKDTTQAKEADKNDFGPELTREDAVKQRKQRIKDLEKGDKTQRQLAALLKQCRKGERCKLTECPVCERLKLISLKKVQRREKSSAAFSRGKGSESAPGQAQSIDYVTEIAKEWHRNVDSSLKVGRLCADASKVWSDAERLAFVEKLPFKESAFSKYKRIGLDKRLYSVEMRPLLPPHYTTLYALTRLTDDDFKLAVSEGVIHPGLEREALQAWRKARESKPDGKPPVPDIHTALAGSKETKVTANNLPQSAGAQPTAVSSNQTSEAGPLATSPMAETESPSIAPTDGNTIPSSLDRRQPSPEDESNLQILLRTWGRSSDWVRHKFKQHIQAGTAHA